MCAQNDPQKKLQNISSSINDGFCNNLKAKFTHQLLQLCHESSLNDIMISFVSKFGGHTISHLNFG